MTHHYTRVQKRDPQRNQYRYYVLDVQPHLFGGWSLIREWGRIGVIAREYNSSCPRTARFRAHTP
jgi:predicted DNA-binding WGR domain protein